MTLADVQAVSPETLTPWKEELTWRPYVHSDKHLTHIRPDHVYVSLERADSEAR